MDVETELDCEIFFDDNDEEFIAKDCVLRPWDDLTTFYENPLDPDEPTSQNGPGGERYFVVDPPADDGAADPFGGFGIDPAADPFGTADFADPFGAVDLAIPGLDGDDPLGLKAMEDAANAAFDDLEDAFDDFGDAFDDLDMVFDLSAFATDFNPTASFNSIYQTYASFGAFNYLYLGYNPT